MKRLFVLFAAALSAAAWTRAETETPRFRLAAGPVWSPGAELSARWHPETARGLVPFAWGTTKTGGGAPPATGFANRDYEDGHVRLDAGTTDPETMEYGLTWNWGYDRASQYDASTVAFHTPAATTTTFRQLDASVADDRDDLDFFGADVAATLVLGNVLGGEGGLSLGVRWFGDEDEEFVQSAAVALETRSSSRYVDRYDAHWAGFPSAPYSGTEDGPGYLLDNVPMSRSSESLGRSSTVWTVQSRAHVELERLELRLGVPFEWRFAGDRITLGIAPHVACGRLELTADVETTVAAGNAVKVRDARRAEKDAWIVGAGAEVTLAVALGRGWSVAAGVAGDAWFDDLAVSAGSFDFKAELGAWSFRIALAKEF